MSAWGIWVVLLDNYISVASKRCKIEVPAFPHASESNSTVTFFPQ